MSPTPDPDARPAALPDRVRSFLARPHYLALASVEPDGAPRQAVLWYDLVGDEILVNSRVDRRWPRNLQRDGRVGLAVYDRQAPEQWVGLTGVVAAIDDDPERALADIQGLSRRYHPGDEVRPLQFVGQPRITFRIRITSFHADFD